MPKTENMNARRRMLARQIKSNSSLQENEAARISAGLDATTLDFLTELGLEVTGCSI